MNSEKIIKITKSLQGLKKHEWEKVKAYVDLEYNRNASKIELAGLEDLNKMLEDEFIQ